MTVLTTIDVYDMPNSEYRAVMDRIGVEAQPEPGIYLHITAQPDFGYRVIEIWDSQDGCEEYAQRRMLPALSDLGIDRWQNAVRRGEAEATTVQAKSATDH